MDRYYVDIKSARCPSRYWGHAKVVRVIDRQAGDTERKRVLHGTIKQWGDQYSGRGTWHLDAKYSGPRSAYGQALRAARALADKLNAESEQAQVVL